MRTPSHIPKGVVNKEVENYLREIKRIQRAVLRKVLTNPSVSDGSPVSAGEELEFLIEDMEALINAGDHDQETIHQLIDSLNPLTDVNEEGVVEWQRVHERVSPPRTASGNRRSRRKGKKQSKRKQRPNRY